MGAWGNNRPPTGGGGGGGDSARIAPDAFDQLVAYDCPNYAGASWPNSGAAGSSLDLVLISSYTARPALGVFGDVMWTPTPLISTSYGGVARASPATALQSQTLTASTWIYVPELQADATAYMILAHQYAGAGAWQSPYDSWAMASLADGSILWAATTSAGSNACIIQSDVGTLTPGLHHIGLTLGGGVMKGYFDGALVDDYTLDSAVVYDGGGGSIVLLGIPSASNAAQYSIGSGGDMRIAIGVARDVDWFSSVWATRRQP